MKTLYTIKNDSNGGRDNRWYTRRDFIQTAGDRSLPLNDFPFLNRVGEWKAWFPDKIHYCKTRRQAIQVLRNTIRGLKKIGSVKGSHYDFDMFETVDPPK